VTCSREESLAIIAYTSEPNKMKENALKQEWFTAEEIVTL
jgi:DNA helicase II / ATP-dependent DNA helicase PcrA